MEQLNSVVLTPATKVDELTEELMADNNVQVGARYEFDYPSKTLKVVVGVRTWGNESIIGESGALQIPDAAFESMYQCACTDLATRIIALSEVGYN